MMFEAWLESIASMLGISTSAAGTLMAIIFTVIVLLMLAAAGASLIAEAIAGVGMLGFFTAAGWFNVWLMLLVGITVAYLLAKELSKTMKGG